jgi:tetratricopeptide (TPR) repeat protein
MDRMARGSLAAACMATIAVVGWHLVLTPRARTAGAGTSSALRQPYRPEAEERYRTRIRQLEEDLRVDPSEYGVMVKLASLHTRLGLRQTDPVAREADLDRARELYRLASQPGVAAARREYEFVMGQLERLSGRYPPEEAPADQVPSSDPVSGPSAFMFDMEQWLRLRLELLRARVVDMPDNVRLLCRLGWTYYRLAQAVSRREGTTVESLYYPDSGLTPDDLLERAIEVLQHAARISRTREYRVEAYHGLAVVYQEQERWKEALGALRRIVALQPNNWPANQRMASVLQRMQRPVEAQDAVRRGNSWRTPEWF